MFEPGLEVQLCFDAVLPEGGVKLRVVSIGLPIDALVDLDLKGVRSPITTGLLWEEAVRLAAPDQINDRVFTMPGETGFDCTAGYIYSGWQDEKSLCKTWRLKQPERLEFVTGHSVRLLFAYDPSVTKVRQT